jgi:hypothetical protein
VKQKLIVKKGEKRIPSLTRRNQKMKNQKRRDKKKLGHEESLRPKTILS